jgi:hypothetical protein
MPIEIRELVIRATVDSGDERRPRPETEAAGGDRTELIEECVEQVLDILRKREER